MDANPHQLVICPYNISHQIEHYRMHIHIQKCRKQYELQKKPNNKRMLTCPFDTTHVIVDDAMAHHITECPKRFMFDSQVYVPETVTRPPVEVVGEPVTYVPTSENWDEDEVPAYDPKKAKQGTAIIQKAKGMTPSERRLAREQARLAYVSAASKEKPSEG